VSKVSPDLWQHAEYLAADFLAINPLVIMGKRITERGERLRFLECPFYLFRSFPSNQSSTDASNPDKNEIMWPCLWQKTLLTSPESMQRAMIASLPVKSLPGRKNSLFAMPHPRRKYRLSQSRFRLHMDCSLSGTVSNPHCRRMQEPRLVSFSLR